MATAMEVASGVAIERLDVDAYTIPTDRPESDGTLEWDETTIVVVRAQGGDRQGLGYTYGDASVATFVASKLADAVRGCDAMAPAAAWETMQAAVRNAGREGVGAMAISAVDIALWDLKAHLCELPVLALVPAFHEAVPVYGSGGFCSYSQEELAEQLGGWAADGLRSVKMKVGREPDRDEERLRVAREAVGDEVELMVDANGAYERKQALEWAGRYAEHGVTWLEEPVSSDDLEGLRLVRDEVLAGLEITAGEYGWTLEYFERMLEAGAVDVLQADVTRCGGITGFLAVGALCQARGVPLSAHCAPAVSAHACCGIEPLRHLEYFHDHVRIENMLFDGIPQPRDGELRPDPSVRGLGLELRDSDASRYAV